MSPMNFFLIFRTKTIKQILDMPLSARTVHDRTTMMANQVEKMQVKDINAAPFCFPGFG